MQRIPSITASAILAGAASGFGLAAWTVADQAWLSQGRYRLIAEAFAEYLVGSVVVVGLGVLASVVAQRIVERRLELRWVFGFAALAALPTRAVASLLEPTAVLWSYDRTMSPLAFLARALCELWWIDLAMLTALVAAGFAIGFRPRRDWVPAGPPRVALVVVALVGLLGIGVAIDRERPREGHDVVVIVIDTLRADHLSAFGHGRPTSPHLERFAADGVRFDSAISPAAWTAPALTAIMTGQLARRFGFTNRPIRIPSDTPTLVEAMRDHGWSTHGIIANMYGGPAIGLDQGFLTFSTEHVGGGPYVSSQGVADLALERIAWHGSPPLHLHLHFNDPHSDYVDHEGWSWFVPGAVQSPQALHDLWTDAHAIPPDVRQEVAALYDEEIAYTDLHVGRVLDALREAGRYDDALIVVTADHGEELGEDDEHYFGHGVKVSRALTRVPLIVKLPGNVHAGRVVDTPVSLLDLAPTIGHVTGVPFEGDGQVLPLADGPPDPGRRVFSETMNRQREWLRSVVSHRYRLVRNEGTGAVELYDRLVDPGEDVHDLHPDVVADLSAALDEWSELAGPTSPAVLATFTEEEREMLEELGYVE